MATGSRPSPDPASATLLAMANITGGEFASVFVHERPYTYLRPDPAYALVSSFYGIGNTIGWLLTVASCFCSWCFDPKKRHSGAITPDFVATLTFPAIAAAHLIAQTSSPPKAVDDARLADQIISSLEAAGLTGQGPGSSGLPVADPNLVASILAIEAALNVTETFMGICVLLLFSTVRSRCFWRTVLLAAVGLLCFAAETHLYFSSTVAWNLSRINLSRLFLVSFPRLLIIVDVLLFAIFPPCLCVVALLWLRRRSRTNITEDAARSLMGRHTLRQGLTSRLIHALPIGTLAATMSGWLLASLYPLASNTVSFGQYVLTASLPPGDILHRILANLVPRTATSIRDLDQAVAVLAGSTVLAFSVYNALMPRLLRWRARNETRREREAYELRRLAQVRANGAR